MHIAIEKSTLGLELTFKEGTDLIPAAAITSLTWELLSEKSGYSNPIQSGAEGALGANPFVVVLDLTSVTVDAAGARLVFDAKFTYNSSVLGSGAVGRIDPIQIRLERKRMSG